MAVSSDWLDVRIGDCRVVLDTLPDASVHCVVTSPPYWGLRDYGTASWEGGDPECDHGLEAQTYEYRDACGKCGAHRIDSQLGLEATPEEYVANMVDVFRKVRRVLRDDGTLWLNLGDSYYAASATGNTFTGGKHQDIAPDTAKRLRDEKNARLRALAGQMKPKDLVGIPWRVAFALQADGWYLRSDIIWSKPNPMPESVTDRPTKAHEYVFLLSKSPRYHFDQEAVREDVISPARAREKGNGESAVDTKMRGHGSHAGTYPAGRNIRTVWTIPTKPYPGAHFAVFPPDLVGPCIKAGTSERGVCPECGAPWERMVDRWAPSCDHAPIRAQPATVLDPFAGSGTVGYVAQKLSRRAILIDLNPDYLEQIEQRTAQVPLGV